MHARYGWRLSHLSTVFSAMPLAKLLDCFTLYTVDDLDLAVFWSIPDTKQHGNHYTLGMNLGVQQAPLQPEKVVAMGRSLFAQTEREKMALLNQLVRNRHLRDDALIKVTLVAPDRYTHDFAAKRLTIFP
jgi:hypothetical protein